MTNLFIINNNSLMTLEGTFRNRKYWGGLTTKDKLILNDNLKIIRDFKNYNGETITQLMSCFNAEEISHLNNLFVENLKKRNWEQYTKKQLLAIHLKDIKIKDIEI